jgi:site-specific recombinase XerD
MKTLLYIVTKKKNKKGLAPIYCRITINGRRAEFSTGYFVKPEHWEHEAVKPCTDEYTALNSSLTTIKSEVNRIYHDLYNRRHVITSEKVKRMFVTGDTTDLTFMEMFEEFYDHKCESTNKRNTLRTYGSRKELVFSYLVEMKLTHIMPDEFDFIMAERFINYNVNVRKLARNYVNRAITFTKESLRFGKRIKALQESPLQDFRMKHDKDKPIIALTKNELLSLTTHKFASERLQDVADCYIFQSFTGFAYVDLCKFSYALDVKTIKNKKWIIQDREKTLNGATIPLFADALRVLKKHGLKLPIISLQKYNSYLKEIADILGIKKNLTTHTARKTFGMVKLNDGFSMESVSKMLGHKQIKTTQKRYAQVDLSRIVKEQKQLRIR